MVEDGCLLEEGAEVMVELLGQWSVGHGHKVTTLKLTTQQ
jgi:hypothetical protein